ncbi:MAG: hypothetical protein ACRC7O_16635, partial [Fimbriiglobus sp.]
SFTAVMPPNRMVRFRTSSNGIGLLVRAENSPWRAAGVSRLSSDQQIQPAVFADPKTVGCLCRSDRQPAYAGRSPR